ncbi:MAG: peptidoglycan editing factor PgeF [Betaproteobacteria bacterium]|nr:peptidoglycan editing factor PgeF [Betaproteobacteria bacterium]
MKVPHDWIVPDWPAPPRVKCLITTRNGGISAGAYATFNLGLRTGDAEKAVRANRRQLLASLPQAPKWLRQVHAARVIVADGLTNIPEADASIARNAGTVCAVMIADCMPVLLCDRAGSVVGIAHAGWRGLNAGVIENTVHDIGIAPDELLAYLGPAIGPDAFEVGADVRDAFLAADPAADEAFKSRREGKWLADLFQLARRRLARCGVRRVFGGELCTYRDPARFYSYRRDKATGRMAALIWLDA